MTALKAFIRTNHFLTICLFVCCCLLLFTILPGPGENHPLASAKASVAPASQSAAVPEAQPTPPPARLDLTIYTGTIRAGDTLERSFTSHEVPRPALEMFIEAFKDRLDFSRLQPGETYSVSLDPEGRMIRGTYRINPFTSYTAQADDDGMHITRDRVELAVHRIVMKGTVDSSLFAAFPEDLKSSKLVYAFADIFAAKMDFNTETREGDRFDLIVDEYSLDGDFIGYGPILAARYRKTDGDILDAYRMAADGRNFSYYDEQGQELGASFIRSPVGIGRVSSRFTHHRLHPILGVVREHLGVDLAAPAGTPVMAAADGRVVSMGTNGGFGKQIVLAHSGDYRTYYGHLSRFKPGLKVGSRVNQKQVIGFVGSTGLATGPHLDYRLQDHGVFKNPFALKFQPKSKLGGDALQALATVVADLSPHLESPQPSELIEARSLILDDDQQPSML